jgi:hypothetical protein
MVNLSSIEADARPATPEQKLWRAVFMQAIQDTFGICTVAMSRDEHGEKLSGLVKHIIKTLLNYVSLQGLILSKHFKN